jgi:hypothetical protein
METSSLRTFKIMPRNLNEIDEFGFWRPSGKQAKLMEKMPLYIENGLCHSILKSLTVVYKENKEVQQDGDC